MLCGFGCGREGKYLFKNGKWCCSKYANSCPAKKEEMTKRKHSEETKIKIGNGVRK